MFRLLIATLLLCVGVLASGCGQSTKCGDLCYPDQKDSCGVGTGLTCVSPGKCQVFVPDAGPGVCPSM